MKGEQPLSAVQESILELELNAILQNSKENIVVTNGDGYVLRANSNCYSIYGTEYGYFIGKSVYQLEQEGILCPSVTSQALKQRAKAQAMQKTRTGRIVLATGVPVFDRGGRIVRVVSSSYDLTDIQLLRDEYERLQAKTLGVQPVLARNDLSYRPKGMNDLVFASTTMRDVVELILRVAKADVAVLFLGETGVGKTALARFLHINSHRSGGRFIELNCSAIPESLFESQMFGYEAGAFTGADKHGKIGLIELANKGTLFLDEIGDLPLAMQAKLLKVLEERKLMRLGSAVERRIDFRVVASSNRNLKELVDQGKFRPDLYYRLSVFPITVPPLRLRQEDITILVEHFRDRLNARYGCRKELSRDGLERLRNSAWPGNIRELKNTLERLWLTTNSDLVSVGAADLDGTAEAAKEELALEQPYLPDSETLKQALQRLERDLLTDAHRRCKTTYEMAACLGISQASVVRKLKKYGIDS